jgi:predicted nuclease with RNAse H fold
VPSPWTVVGIDPAPSKASIACIDGGRFQAVEPADLRSFVRRLLAEHDQVLLAWDAPLSFDPASGFSDRPVDREIRAWVRKEVANGFLRKGAVSVLPFCGCPHWAISCAALGMPFGHAPSGLKLATTPEDGKKLVIEVHPAVSLARWWVSQRVPEPMPRYKRGRGIGATGVRAALDLIRSRLPQIAEEAIVDDDHLDAWLAWKMGDGFLRGETQWVGSPREGGYVLPT